MNTLVKISGLLSIIAAVVLLVLSSGCAGLGRAAKTAVGLYAPEYKATADNLFTMIADDRIFADDTIVVAVETSDGRRWPVSDVRFIARAEDSWTLDAVPPGVMRRLSGKPRNPDIDRQSRLLGDMLKTVPSTNEEKEKSK